MFNPQPSPSAPRCACRTLVRAIHRAPAARKSFEAMPWQRGVNPLRQAQSGVEDECRRDGRVGGISAANVAKSTRQTSSLQHSCGPC